MRPLLALLLLAPLAGCANPQKALGPSEAEALRAGWYEPSAPRVYAARYCYRTLAAVDCHAVPVAGAEGRLVGFHDPGRRP